jgi:carbon starvation protein
MRPEITGPAFIAPMSAQGPIWPILFVTVACGAISGFHSVVSSGTTAKQLGRESQGRLISYGGMLTEGALAMIVVLLISSVLFWDTAPSGGESGFVFTTLLADKGANITFGTAMGRAMTSLGIPLEFGIAFGVLMLNAFVLTSLDTCARLTRYVMAESIGQKFSPLRNPYIATAAALLLAFLLTTGGGWRTLWPAFGAANQLIGALSLLVVTADMFGHKRPTNYTLWPGLFMLATTIGALVYQLFWIYVPTGNRILGVTAGMLIVLAVVMAAEVYKRHQRPRGVEAGGKEELTKA